MTLIPPTRRPGKNKPKTDEEQKVISSEPSISFNTSPIQGEESTELPEPSKEKIDVKYEGAPFILHEIECLCFSRIQQTLAHDAHGRRIEVFSLVDSSGSIVESTIQCEDCGRKWIVTGIDDYDLATIDSEATYTRKKLQKSLPNDIVNVCDEYKISTAIMEYINWIFDTKAWGSQIILSSKKYRREDINFDTKLLIINSPTNFVIKDMKTSNIAELY